ncbi:MAG TPA: protein kinase [Gemmatimonadaceae bacterium]|nr:protein kinase [Gemmatimonadaceae bacterium]
METIAQLNTTLAGRYTLEREIGQGGMATVFLARDLKHDRNVALKVLKPELGAVLGVERFLAEIKVTANLQHPNLLPLFDSGEANGLLFYVMPFVEGESLRARLDRETQLPIDDAIRIAVAVASALDYAHRRQVIHRDLKPENILLHEGQPLVADFGIALAVSKAGGARITQTGLSLGTPQYMSPEQATGDRAVDGRTDIYSLGAVTYEMLAGEPPHTGPTAQSIMAKLMTEEVRPLTVPRRSVPAYVDQAVRHALEKLPADRWATAHEFAEALEGKTMSVLLGAGAAGASSHERYPRTSRERLRDPAMVALAAGALALAVLSGWEWTRAHQPNPPSTSRFALTLPKDQRILDTEVGGTLAISPDGGMIAFVSQPSSSAVSRVFIRPIDQMGATPLGGTEAARDICFSPDGKWIAFAVGSAVKKVSVDGGPVATLAVLQTTGVRGLSWGTPTHIVVGSPGGAASPGGLFEVPASGGNARLAVKTNRAGGEGIQRWPLALPDGKTVLFMSAPGSGSSAGSRIGIASLETGRARILDVEGIHPIGLLHGELVYASLAGTVMAVRFDARKGTVSGAQFPLVEDVLVDKLGDARVALSATGTLVYLSGTSQTQPVLVDARGAATPLIGEARDYLHPRFSPDGQRVAFTVGSPQGNDIWVFDRAKTTFTRLTAEGAESRPEWSTDGKRILFLSTKNRSSEIRWEPADGSGSSELMYKSEEELAEAVLSPDGAWLLYRTGSGAPHPLNISAVPLKGDRKPVRVFSGPFRYLMPRVSPDGRWLAYQSDESGRFEIYVQPFPGSGARAQVSVDGGIAPLWARSGRTLYYNNGKDVFAVAVTTGQAFSIGARTAAVTGDFLADISHPNYDVAPDGAHFLMLKRPGEDARAIVVLNWGRELDAKRAAQGAR